MVMSHDAKYDFHQLMPQGTTKGLSSLKASRISLIDLAGLDVDSVDDGRRHVQKSLSQLG
jgi:hypothetical protein